MTISPFPEKTLVSCPTLIPNHRSNLCSEPQFKQLKEENPYGFDIVVEATGSVKILEDAINYVRRGGKLVVYGVYNSDARVSWPPSKIFGDEITILGSFSETYKCMLSCTSARRSSNETDNQHSPRCYRLP